MIVCGTSKIVRVVCGDQAVEKCYQLVDTIVDSVRAVIENYKFQQKISCKAFQELSILINLYSAIFLSFSTISSIPLPSYFSALLEIQSLTQFEQHFLIQW